MTGGFALAARWAGIKTVQFVEIDPFCQNVLQKNFPGVPIHDDIKTFTYATIKNDGGYLRGTKDRQEPESGGCVEPGITESTKSATHRPNPFILTAGTPCQPASCAGKRKGTEDDRWLWGETFRVIAEVKPKWCILENVRGLLTLENGLVFDNLLSELEAIGYETRTYIIPACAKNAPHRRDRIWIVAHRTESGLPKPGLARIGKFQAETGKGLDNRFEQQASHAPDTDRLNGDNGRHDTGEISQLKKAEVFGMQFNTDTKRAGLEGRDTAGSGCTGRRDTAYAISRIWQNKNEPWDEPWLEAATRLCRVPNGVSEELYKLETSDRVGRLKALGNAIVPQVAYEIMKAIVETEVRP